MFASTVVGAGSIAATGATSPLPPPGMGGAPGFIEQLLQATGQEGNSGAAEETPASIFSIIDASSQNAPATPARVVPFNIAKPVERLPNSQTSTDDTVHAASAALARDRGNAAEAACTIPIPAATSKGVVGPRKLLQTGKPVAEPAFAVRIRPERHPATPQPTTPGSVPVVARGSHRQASPHNPAPEAAADPHTQASGLPSDQNNSIPAPIAPPNSAPEFASQPSPVLLQTAASITATPPIRTDAPFHPNIGELAFAARIKPQSHPVSAANPIAYDHPAPQSVKATREAPTQQGDHPGSDEQENSPPLTPSSVSAPAKASFRKDEPAAVAANVVQPNVEPNPAPLTHPITQPVSTNVAEEPRSTATPTAPSAQSVARPEPTHVLLDKPSQATSPARSISLQVEGPSGHTVDIRIASRSGDLNVAVRAGDDNVAQNLRQGLGDLESRLSQNGYRAETWHPGHSGPTTEPTTPGGGSSSHSSSQQQSQSGHGSRQDRGQRDNNPSNRPRWVNELASSLKTRSTGKGNENGIGT